MPPFVNFVVDLDGTGSTRMLRYDDLGTPSVEISDNLIAIKCLVGEQSAELQTIDKRFDADGIESLPRQELKSNEIAKCISQSEDFGRHATLGPAYGLPLSPPFAPCP